MVIVLRSNGENCGRFGMSLVQAKDYFLARAKKYKLEPYRLKEDKESVFISFYHPAMKKPDGWRMPWEGLRDLAYDFAGRFDESGDPPWDYTLKVEKPLPQPPDGKFVTMEGRLAHGTDDPNSTFDDDPEAMFAKKRNWMRRPGETE